MSLPSRILFQEKFVTCLLALGTGVLALSIRCITIFDSIFYFFARHADQMHENNVEKVVFLVFSTSCNNAESV